VRASGILFPTALVGLALLASVPSPAPAAGNAAKDGVLATVDGDPVTTRDLRVLLAQQAVPADPAGAAGVTADGLLKRLIQNRLLEQEGYRMGLDETPDVVAQVNDVLRHRGMMALLDSVSAPALGDDEATVELPPLTSRMFRVSHVLVETPAEAAALRDSANAGTPFADLAERHSLDRDASHPGGELGWAREDKFIPEFAAALKDLSPGDVSAPVQTADGWHLLWLMEERTETIAPDGRMAQIAREAEKRERVMTVVRDYVASLKEKYDVVTNDSLLATLDYGSEDPQVLRALIDSDEMIVRLPWREFTVADFTRQIRFEHFHGLAGKPDAPQLRDRTFDEWITEMLLRHEAVELGFHRRPEIAASGEQMKREQVREKVGQAILDFRFEPTDAEVERYYRDHRDRFSPRPRIRATGVLLSGREAAERFRQRAEAGAQIPWLAERTPEVVDAAPELFRDWLAPEDIALAGVPETGQLVGPLPAGDAWAVARIIDVQTVPPLPLAECRPQVLVLMKSDRVQEVMNDALARLEAAATIEVADGAEQVIRKQIEEWRAAGARSGGGGGSPHGGMPHGAGREVAP